jgi:D-alanyl-D-alanine carboxypeptidase
MWLMLSAEAMARCSRIVGLRMPSRRTSVRALGALFAFALVLGPSIADAGTAGNNPSAERAKVRAQKAKVATQVNALKATDAQVDRALADLAANVNGQQARVNEAQRAVSQAEQAYADAQAAVTAKQAEIEQLKQEVREFAVQAFVHPPGDDAAATLDSENPSDAAERRALLDLQSNTDADVLDQLSAAEEDLQVQKDLAEQARAKASAKKAELQSQLDDLKAAKAQQQVYADQVQDRLDQALFESANLETLDRQLSEQIRQDEISRASRAGGRGGGGGSAVGNVDTGRASCPTGGGITVAASIVDDVQRLLDDAHADGVDMCGGGYRSSADQIATRKANGCPDVYSSPASACHPPTAPPGKSMHERGLAIDFTQGGRALNRDSSGFKWLSAHAGSYGFHNLPSEPWHWSTNGN